MPPSPAWKKGRGRQGLLDPLFGSWIATGDSPLGPFTCRRTFSRALDNACVILVAHWSLPANDYLEHTIFCPNDEGVLAFWSFTSDGKRSSGVLADAGDIDARAFAFLAKMPAGFARMAYWPSPDTGLGLAEAPVKSQRGHRSPRMRSSA